MDDRTRDRLQALCCDLGEACAERVAASSAAMVAHWSKAAAAALGEIARLVLLSADVILPGEPTPCEGFEPVTVRLGADLVIVVDPSPDGPKVSFMRRLD